ncbi:MAG TPA: hypothetical protein VF516_06080 [Kofleriaceae bacterium]
MRQEVDGVLHATGALQRAGVHRDPQGLGQLLGIERLGLTCQLDGALQESTIEVGLDESLPEREQGTLREQRFRRPQAAEHHLPAQIQERQLDRRCVGGARVRLQEQHHRHERRWVSVLAGAGISIHPFELGLKCLVEQLVALQSKEGVELAVSLEPTKDELLLAADRLVRAPALDRHRVSAAILRGGSRGSRSGARRRSRTEATSQVINFLRASNRSVL